MGTVLDDILYCTIIVVYLLLDQWAVLVGILYCIILYLKVFVPLLLDQGAVLDSDGVPHVVLLQIKKNPNE